MGAVGFSTTIYWHARGYGLFAATPLDQSIFSHSEEEFGFKLAVGESMMFRHRLSIISDIPSELRINERYDTSADEAP